MAARLSGRMGSAVARRRNDRSCSRRRGAHGQGCPHHGCGGAHERPTSDISHRSREGDQPVEEPVTEALTHRVAVVPSPRPVGDTVDARVPAAGPAALADPRTPVPAPRTSGSPRSSRSSRVPARPGRPGSRGPSASGRWDASRVPVPPARRPAAAPMAGALAVGGPAGPPDARPAPHRRPPCVDGPPPLPDRCRSRRRGRSTPIAGEPPTRRIPEAGAVEAEPSGIPRSIRRTPRRCGSRWSPAGPARVGPAAHPAHDLIATPSPRPRRGGRPRWATTA